MNVLILCTGNSCRSQMAEGFLKTFNKKIKVYSAGTSPSKDVHKNAIIVMKELGVDITNSYPKFVNQFLNKKFEYVITVCGDAKENCPIFLGKVKNNIHIGFNDPDKVKGSDEFIMNEFRRIRNEILVDFYKFYQQNISNLL